ncbi:hypothetical protein [Kineothrix sedimenti]|uniref:Uncharacterized protein n=1 Tax=Kineothrix sedimenti TaxID=3123317 RepID=A0ABZ3F098_9FIRM
MLDQINIEVIEIFEHFKSNLDNSVNGLYNIKINGNKAIIFRNGDSWGVLAHYLGEPVNKCMGILREDRIELIEEAIKRKLNTNNN